LLRPDRNPFFVDTNFEALMKPCLLFLLIFFTSLCATFAKPEVARFKNGDRLTGEWLRIEDNKVVFKTKTIGEVKIPVDKLVALPSPEPVVMVLKSGETVQGKIAPLESGDWQVQVHHGTLDVPAKAIQAIYPEQEYQKYGYARRPRVWENWKGKGAMGYSLVKGDQNAKTLSVNLSATRRAPELPHVKERSRTNYFLNLIVTNTQTDQGLRISTNNFTSGVRQDFVLGADNFWFLLTQFDHSDTQSLNLRQTYGGGFGRDLIHSSGVDLQLLGGMTWVKENFETDVERSSGEGLIGEKFGWKVTRWLGFDHALSLYPSLTDGGAYRIDTSSALSTKITKRFSFNTTYTDHYLSRPLPNRRKNEIVLTTGLGFNF
jgi:putative salt-induced outer membrane protein YdiY